MQVQRQIPLDRQVEHPFHQRPEVGHRIGDRAHHAARPLHLVGHAGHGRVPEMLDAGQAGRLQFDLPGPFGAHFFKHRPGDGGLRRNGIQVGADRRGAVGIGAAQGEIEPGAHVGRVPAARAVAFHRLQRAHETAVGVGRARPDMALVQMGMDVHIGRPDLAAVQVHRRKRRASGAAPRRPGRMRAIRPPVDQDFHRRHAVCVGHQTVGAVDQADRHPAVGSAEPGRPSGQLMGSASSGRSRR